jgi:hypothetical protein
MRVNEKALGSILDMRKKQSSHSVAPNQKVPFPLPDGSVNIHIRRGNKVGEMDLLAANVYVDAYTRLVASEPLGFAKRWIYVSSDTLNPILETIQLLDPSSSTSTVIYSVMPRLENGFCHDAWNRFPQNSTQSTLLLLMELFMALEADSWVGTRISCWGRMIDLLRCIWTNKCKNQFVEVGYLRQEGRGDQHMYHDFIIPKHAKPYGKQQVTWDAPDSLFEKK